MKTIHYLLICLATILLSCGDDDDQVDPSIDIIGLWEFDESFEGLDALYFDRENNTYVIRYGSLGEIDISQGPMYSLDNNSLEYFPFGTNPIPYSGGNILEVPGNQLTKVDNVNDLSDFTTIVDMSDVESNVLNSLTPNPLGSYNLDGRDQHLFIPNFDNFSYLLADKNSLEVLAEIEVDGQPTSIAVTEAPIDILEFNRFRVYNDNNPAMSFPGLDIQDNSYQDHRIHAHTLDNSYDFVSFNRVSNQLQYFDVTNAHTLQEVSTIITSLLDYRGMDYAETNEVLIISTRNSIHFYDAPLNNTNSSLTSFIYISSATILPESNQEAEGINGLYYDEETANLFVIISNESTASLVRVPFELPEL